MQLDFCIIGPQRTGTSWIDKLLRLNPAVCLPRNVKETFFFDQHYDKGLDYYFRYFHPKEHHKLHIEVAPTYFSNSKVAKRLKSTFTDCKAILIVRNPIDQAFSLYQHHKAKGRVKGNLIEAVKEMPTIIKSGHYEELTKSWINVLGEENLIILQYSELKNDPKSFYKKFLKILEIPYYPLDDSYFKEYGKSTNPRFKLLSKYAAAMASYLRRNNLHILPEIGKRLGITLVFKGKSVEPISQLEHDFLLRWFKDDIRYLESKFSMRRATEC
jgi:sulfotransferase family protein